MKENQALDAFMALSQETRLAIVRLLVKQGPEGLAAGRPTLLVILQGSKPPA